MTATDIANLALGYLGDSATVTSLDPPEGSAQAQHCARFYPIALKLMMEAHRWNFNTKRDYLALMSTDYFGSWRYVYAAPSDAADVFSVLPKACYPQNTWWYALSPYLWPAFPFDVEQNYFRDFEMELVNGKQCILSNACDAVIRYTVGNVQPGLFSAQFTNALARLLASMIAGPLLKGDAGAAEGKRQYAAYQLQLEQAKSSDANQRTDPRPPVPSNILARF